MRIELEVLANDFHMLQEFVSFSESEEYKNAVDIEFDNKKITVSKEDLKKVLNIL